MASTSILIFQADLRLTDNPALTAALHRGDSLICLYVWNPDAEEYAKPGAASQWWLHHSLTSLSEELQRLGNRLLLRIGQPREVLADLLDTLNNPHVFWNRSCEPSHRQAEQHLKNFLTSEKIQNTECDGNTLLVPTNLQTQARQPYRVFTPFWNCLRTKHIPRPLASPTHLLPQPALPLKSESIDSLGLLPAINWAEGIQTTWNPGEQGAQRALQKFLKTPIRTYSIDRDRPDYPHTSRLSPYLHFGEISPRTIWQKIQIAKQKNLRPNERNNYDAYLRQLAWREFSQYLLLYFPHTVHEPLNSSFRKFPYEEHKGFLRSWQKGITGYPIVDAGMRELWQTGWMHNRVRMITASFLTKHLLIPWQKGAAWFWDTLVDADLANNTMGWQWVAGCGADASPFFRIFNPVTQGIKFDPDGNYVRKWVPELADLPAPWIHKPWDTPPLLLLESHIHLGETYPYPMVDHAKSRARALLAYQQFKKGQSPKPSPSSKEQEKEARP